MIKAVTREYSDPSMPRAGSQAARERAGRALYRLTRTLGEDPDRGWSMLAEPIRELYREAADSVVSLYREEWQRAANSDGR